MTIWKHYALWRSLIRLRVREPTMSSFPYPSGGMKEPYV